MVTTRSRKDTSDDEAPAAKRMKIETVEYNPPHSVFTDMQVLRAMWFPNIKGDTHQDQLESFYKSQAHLYDSYRCRMLHGRKPLVKAMPANKGDVWVDLGGGTGSNLEFFGENIKAFKKVIVVDLTPSLVEVAKERVEAKKWTNVDVVLGDATDTKLEGLPEPGTVDLLTISYALTMIPNWKDALANAKRLLKPGGHIAICDFTVDSTQWSFSQFFWKKLFASDHVFLSAEHREYLKANFPCVHTELGYGTFPYVPWLFKCPFYVYVGRNA
mmetsp:Transcript_19627/g.42900  ORF Transcript_19627/g.42900 Transcript_19627/m.42900 type:complete len:271 (-) Transcript_19627:1349-2161(-)|eukprot:CAMPEP_0118934324 /NCGR_PEP_ID=MMETSP1169-20130426/13763_1 /TAXON_ID=36882 /ORGANISM="Pyramimonas obovata, Strain CCMP722" /LENGTH=270 /DNA_ID=CAMNT_0006877217 /DNA_START=33 /DNA_END=845 /DNA_ORIENTATION=-